MADVKEALEGRGVRHLGVRREGAVVTVTMNRPERRKRPACGGPRRAAATVTGEPLLEPECTVRPSSRGANSAALPAMAASGKPPAISLAYTDRSGVRP